MNHLKLLDGNLPVPVLIPYQLNCRTCNLSSKSYHKGFSEIFHILTHGVCEFLQNSCGKHMAEIYIINSKVGCNDDQSLAKSKCFLLKYNRLHFLTGKRRNYVVELKWHM